MGFVFVPFDRRIGHTPLAGDGESAQKAKDDEVGGWSYYLCCWGRGVDSRGSMALGMRTTGTES